MTDVPAWLQRLRRDRAAREKRTVPLGKVEPGHCRWCEEPILGTRGKHIGNPNPQRSWCRPTDPGGRDCYQVYRLHADPQAQFNWLEINRGLVCAECGAETPQRWRKVGDSVGWAQLPPTPWEGERKGQDYIDAVLAHRRRCFDEFPMWGHATLVTLASCLVVDHVVPIWKVLLTVPLELRRPYFGPDNLQLLCEVPCHKEKTRREATERAALRRSIASGDGGRTCPSDTASAAACSAAGR